MPQPKALRPLLPGPAPRDVADDVTAPSPLTPRAPRVESACDSCRKRKCTGGRPRCRACTNNGLECRYASATAEISPLSKRKFDEMREMNDAYQRFFQVLRAKPEAESAQLLRKVRNGVEPATILRQMQDGDLVTQLALVPEKHLRYEFPCKLDMPAALLQPDNPYLQSAVYQFSFNTNRSKEAPSEPPAICTMPYHVAEIIDPRLPGLVISDWTSVSSDDALLRMLLHSYLLHNYIMYPIFQKDIFLQALRDGDKRFCSSLLVNAVLAVGCNANRKDPKRAKFWMPDSLVYRFIAEAKRLWELEVERSSLTTLQAAIVLQLLYSNNCMDQISMAYLEQAIAISHKLKLFEPEEKKGRTRIARTFTAWCLFRWQSIYGLHFFKAPLIKRPPATPMPDPDEDPAWYGELWLRYPTTTVLYPVHHGYIFKATAELRHIMVDIAEQMFGNSEKKPLLSSRMIRSYKSRLDSWFKGLPEAISAKKAVLPWQHHIHMEYSVVQLRISELKPDPNYKSPMALSFITTQDTLPAPPEDWLAYLETVLRLYYVQHSYEFTDAIILLYLSIVANAVIDKMASTPGASAHLRPTLVLCMKGIYEQSHHIHVGSIIGFLQRKQMAPDDLRQLRLCSTWNGDENIEQFEPQHTVSDYPVAALKLDEEDVEKTRLESLAKQYQTMEISDETDDNRSPTPFDESSFIN